MKHKTLRTLLCVILTVCFCLSAIAPVSAAGLFSGDTGAASIFDEWIRSLKDRFIEKNPGTDEDPAEPMAGAGTDGFEYKIVFLDCGRKYFSVDSIKTIIDNAAAAGFNYVQLAVGNDGMRFLLDDMSLTVNGVTYSHNDVSAAIHAGNEAYYNFTTDELTQTEMDTIIAYAKEKGIGIIPCVNTPGHMDAILDAAEALTKTTCSYNGSGRTIDVTNDTAVAFTQAFVQKYINYFAGKGCNLFNMGADEYANDIYTGGSMGFGNLQSTGKYSYYVTYVNQLAGMIKAAGMTPMAFNDGIYFNNSDTSSGTFDTDIIICYWSNGWNSYTPMPATTLASKGFRMVNTNGSYYWVLGKTDAQCDANKASGFNYKAFPGGTIDKPAGAMFCIWCDNPGAETEESTLTKTAATIAAFGGALPKDTPTISGIKDGDSLTIGSSVTLSVSGGADATWTSSDTEVLNLEAVTGDAVAAAVGTVTAKSVKATALKKGSATVTAVVDGSPAASVTISVRDASDPVNTEIVNLSVGESKTITVPGEFNTPYEDTYVKVETVVSDATTTSGYELINTLSAGTYYVHNTNSASAPELQIILEDAGNGQYYLKNGSNQYVYPNAKYQGFGWWDYSLENERIAVSVENNTDGSFSFYRECQGKALISPVYTYAYVKMTRYNGLTAGSQGNDEDNGYSSLYIYKVPSPVTGKQTTITFRGKAVGATSVTIGGVLYNITVTEENLSTVTPLTVEYWITNSRFKDSSNNYLEKVINATDNGIATEQGVEIVSLVPDTNSKDGRTQVYWQSKILDVTKTNTSTSGTELQTLMPGDDETLNGFTFTKVRYWNGEWQVFTTEWISVDRTSTTVTYNNGNETYTGDKNQLVAYYMELINIDNANGKSELVVKAADWGTKGDGTGNWGYTPESDRCSVSVQIVYEDATTNPADITAAALKSKTIVYGYWSGGRGLGTMIFTGNGYDIYKVTATTGTMRSTASASNTVTVTNLTWHENEKTVWGDDGSLENSVSIGNPARNPSYESPLDNLAWNTSIYNKNNAILIRVYVRTKVTEDTLKVNYFDEKSPELPFYDYNIAVEEGRLFDANFGMEGSGLVNNTVTNINGVEQTVLSDLTKMTEIGAQYRYSKFNLTRCELSADRKTVNLYYTFDNTASFVIDFGLPLTIPYTAINPELENPTINAVSFTSPKYGTVTEGADHAIIYTPTKTVDKIDNFQVTYTGTRVAKDGETQGVVTYQVYIIPATNVLYEENFITNPENSGWTNAGTADSVNQTLEEAGKKQNVYGYDTQVENYNSEQSAITYSMGGAYQATLNLTDLSNTSYTFSEPLKFTFEGTGIDLISECNTNTGMLYVEVIGEKNGGAYRALVDTYFAGDSSEGNTPIIAKGSTIYQVPVVRKLDLPYDKYTVTIKGYLYNKAGAVVNGADTPALASLYSAFGETADDAVSTLVDALAIPGLTVEDIDVIYMDDNSILNPNAEITKVREENSVMAAYTLDAVENTASSATVYVDGFRVYNPLGTSGTVTYEEKNDADEVVATYMSYVSLTNNEAYNADNEGGVVYYPAYDLIKKSAVESEDYSNGLLYVEYDGSTGIASIANYKNQGPQNEIYLAPGASIAFGINNVNGAVYQVSVREVTSGGTITNLVDSNLYVNSTEMYYNFTLQSGTIDGQSYSYAVFTNDKDGVVAVSGLKLSSTVTPFMSKELANMITEKLSKDPTAAFNPSMFEVSYPNTARKNRKFYLNVRASASDVVKVTLTVKDNKGNVVEGYNSLELSPSNSKAVAEGLSKYWMYDQSVKLSAGTYTIEITAYDKDNHTAVYKVSNADGEKAQPVITVK